MLRKEYNLNNSMRQKRKPSCAEISKCMDIVNLEMIALMHMVPSSFKRKPIFQAISWPNFVHNSIAMAYACMGRDANSCTAIMTLKLISPFPKLFVKVADLPSREIRKSVESHSLNAYGPTWRLGMGAEHQKDLVSRALKLYITKTTKKI